MPYYDENHFWRGDEDYIRERAKVHGGNSWAAYHDLMEAREKSGSTVVSAPNAGYSTSNCDDRYK